MSERRAWWACGAGCVLLAVALCIDASADPDLGFHVATGRAVLASGAIPSTNVLSYGEPEHAWINQQWLPATLFALAFDHAGFAGTLAIRIALVALTTLLLVMTAQRLGATRGWTVALVTLGTWASAVRFVERPLLFSNLALAVVLYACASARRAPRFVILAGVAASVAVHLHAGAIFSVLALGVLGIACALEPTAARLLHRDLIAGPREGLALVAAAALSVAAAAALLALYHPSGIEVLLFPLRMASDAYLEEHLVEFRPPFAQPLRVMAPYWAFVLTSVVVVIASLRRAPLPWLAIVAFGLSVSLRHARFVDLAWICGAPALAALASQRWPSVAPSRHVALAVVLAIGALVDRTQLAPPEIGGAPIVWPERLLNVIEQQPLAGPVFVQDGWAGPFLARFSPQERVFFHPAFEAYSPEHYRLYQSIRYGEPGWDDSLDRFGVQLVMMRYTTARERELQAGRPNLRQRLAASPAWALVAADDVGEIFAQRAGPNGPVSEAMPSGVDPDRLAFTGAPRVARGGLEALASAHPSDRVRVMLAVARADDGDVLGANAALAQVHDPALVAIGRSALSRVE